MATRLVATEAVQGHARALALYRAGRLGEAAALYQAILATRPLDVAILVNLAVILRRLGRAEASSRTVRRALCIDPANLAGYVNLANACSDLQRIGEAEGNFRYALLIEPTSVESNIGRAKSLFQLRRPEAAAAAARAAIQRAPERAEAHMLLGFALAVAEGHAAAFSAHRRALTLDPSQADAWYGAGNALRETGRAPAAVKAYAMAVAIAPRHRGAAINLVLALTKSDQGAAAFARGRALLRRWPVDAMVAYNTAAAADQAGRPEVAVPLYRRALCLQPDYVKAATDHAYATRRLDRLDDALRHLVRVCVLDPNAALAQSNRSMIHLSQGRLAEGWQEYDWRFHPHVGCTPARHFPYPRWQGEPLAGRRLLIWGEQGIGDEIRGVSMVPEVAAEASVVLECSPRLTALFARSLSGVEVRPRPFREAQDGRVAFDVQTPLWDLAVHRRRSLADFPPPRPFLAVDAARREAFRKRLDALGPGPRVGLSWRSGNVTGQRAAHFPSVAELGPLLTGAPCTFVCVQYDDCAAELAEIRARFGVAVVTLPDLDLRDDLDGAAALTAALDLVIAPGTSVADIAGAVGTPLLLFWTPHTDQLFLGTRTVPWYRDVALETKALAEPWEPLMRALRGRLDARLAVLRRSGR